MVAVRPLVLRALLGMSWPVAKVGVGRLPAAMSAWRFVARRLVGATATAQVGALTVAFRPDDGLGYHLLARGEWEPFEMALFQRCLASGMTVVDVGAHVGLYAMLAATVVGPTGRVYAFEPDPENFRLLASNIETNGLTNVIPLQKAVAEREGCLTLHHDRARSELHSLRPLGGAALAVEVDSVSLDAFFGEQTVDVIKIDVEGAESAVLAGARGVLAHNPDLALFLEFVPRYLREAGADPDAVLAALRSCGFEMFQIASRSQTLLPVESSVEVAAGANLLCLRGDTPTLAALRTLAHEGERT